MSVDMYRLLKSVASMGYKKRTTHSRRESSCSVLTVERKRGRGQGSARNVASRCPRSPPQPPRLPIWKSLRWKQRCPCLSSPAPPSRFPRNRWQPSRQQRNRRRPRQPSRCRHPTQRRHPSTDSLRPENPLHRRRTPSTKSETMQGTTPRPLRRLPLMNPQRLQPSTTPRQRQSPLMSSRPWPYPCQQSRCRRSRHRRSRRRRIISPRPSSRRHRRPQVSKTSPPPDRCHLFSRCHPFSRPRHRLSTRRPLPPMPRSRSSPLPRCCRPPAFPSVSAWGRPLSSR